MSDFKDKIKATVENMFDGDNQHDNIVDNIEDSMISPSLQKKMDELSEKTKDK